MQNRREYPVTEQHDDEDFRGGTRSDASRFNASPEISGESARAAAQTDWVGENPHFLRGLRALRVLRGYAFERSSSEGALNIPACAGRPGR